MNKTVSVWLKMKDGKNKGKIVLQKRSTANRDFQYICQATWAGKVEEYEQAEVAVKRECLEELGQKFYAKFDFSKLTPILKTEFKINEIAWESYNFLGEIGENALKLAKIHKYAMPEFIFANQEDKIYPMDSGKNPKEHIVLFADQYKILKDILNGN